MTSKDSFIRHLGGLRRALEDLERRVLGEHRGVLRRPSFRERERWGAVDRASYAYGMLRAADLARYFGKRELTACEFGVAQGAGLINMIELAEQITRETGIGFRIVGFDTGTGLPTIEGHKDHPELWSAGDFPMIDRDALRARLGGRAELVFGDIADTAAGFVETLDPDAPLGFVAIDVDVYTGTVAALRTLEGRPGQYLPVVSMYFDDVDAIFANDWCGELAAIHEFNAAHELRKIGRDRSIPGHRPVSACAWYEHMYTFHVLDHEARQRARDRGPLTLDAHQDFVKAYTS